jgi:tryptophan synthase alpha chain
MKIADDVIQNGGGQFPVRGQAGGESRTYAGKILRFAQDDRGQATSPTEILAASPELVEGRAPGHESASSPLAQGAGEKDFRIDSRETGLTRIASAFAAARAGGRAALMPYFTLGYPDTPTSEAVVRAIATEGADLVELGVPFSDPLADGPTIQHSTQIALEQGVTVAGCLQIVARLRAAGVTQPLLLMGYVNPILAYGVSRYVADAAAAGADGFIVPDLPPEEAGELEVACRAHGLALVFLLAPTSTPKRIVAVVSRATGFVYLVSLAGVTGPRDQLPHDLATFVDRVRSTTDLPLAVGFGIATPEHAAAVGALADGVIVGSALIRAVGAAADPAAAASRFVRSLREALAP